MSICKRSKRFALAGGLGLGVLMSVMTAGLAADAANGEKLAKRWCAECHVVAPDQARAQADAPTFAAISASRRVPEIKTFLGHSHPQMPDMNLTRQEISDLIAYMHTVGAPVDQIPPAPQKDDYKPPARG